MEKSEDISLAGVDLARSHATSIKELVDQSGGLLEQDFEVDDELVEQLCGQLPFRHVVSELEGLLTSRGLSRWDQLEEGINDIVLHQDLSSRELLLVLRLALTGSLEGPPLDEVFELLGHDRVIERLRGLSLRCDD